MQVEKLFDKKMNSEEKINLVKVHKESNTSKIPNKKYSIVIPALNEEHTIKKLIETIGEELEKVFSLEIFEIIVIDDGSRDQTYEKASEVQTAKVLRNEQNMGKGYSIRKGIKNTRGKYIAFIDADGSHSVKDLVKGLKIIEKLEERKVQDRPFLITGVRFKNGKHGTTVLNRIGNKLYSLIGLTLWKKNINDLTCGLRFAKKTDLLKMELTSSRYTIEVEMIAESLRRKYTILEMPINATQRIYGTSGVRALKEGIIIPISFILASMKFFSIITKRISI